MTARLIDGKAIATDVRLEVKQEVDDLLKTHGYKPGLAVILVGDDPASEIYVRNKQRACDEVGILSHKHRLGSDISQEELLALVDELNEDETIDGILVQAPLPDHMDYETVVERIRIGKDVDGFHPYNIGRLAIRMPTLRSCTPWGVIELLRATGEKFYGREAVVVGASNHVGRPMGLELLLAGCTATTCHRFTEDLPKHVGNADILIVAVGKPGIVRGEWVKPGATVVDIGINRLEDGRLVGDIDTEGLMERAAWVTPVPGGVGPMTIAMLLKNTLIAARSRFQA